MSYATDHHRWHSRTCADPSCPGHAVDPYGDQKALASKVARDLRGILATLPYGHWDAAATIIDTARAEVAERILAARTPATPCHDYPTDFTLPTTDPDE